MFEDIFDQLGVPKTQRWNLTTKEQYEKLFDKMTFKESLVVPKGAPGSWEDKVREHLESKPDLQYIGVSVPINAEREELFEELYQALTAPVVEDPDFF